MLLFINSYGGSMTLVDLLRQDGALVLLAIGAVIGFFAGKAFRASRGNEHESGEAQKPIAPMPVPVSSQARPAAVIAAITAAVNQYRTENS